ncbi:MAG: efflux RND transporter permease subunit, partial [Vibrio sp.]
LVVIFVLLAVPLKSYVQPMIIMVAIPFGIVGAILGHWWNDLTISILSLNGILALSGVVVNDSLLLVSRYNELVRAQKMPPAAAIKLACSSRLRAVLLTSITTFAGLAPLLSETSMQAQFLIPAAAALGYGILFATLITLILTPSLLMIDHDARCFIARLTQYAKCQFAKGLSAKTPSASHQSSGSPDQPT